MPISNLEKYLPQNTLPFLRVWFGDYFIHIKITRDRKSKLGDYRKKRDLTHEITVNSTLPPQLFFFVLTHELAHLIAFENFGRKIAPHGKEWKQTFAAMLHESLHVYNEDLNPIITKFAKSPKANFMASPDLVRYFFQGQSGLSSFFVEDIAIGTKFEYRKEIYVLEEKMKKNYLCTHLSTGRKYKFSPMAAVTKILK